MWENNLIKLLKAMAKKAPSKFNLLIYSFEGERHDLFLEITDIYENPVSGIGVQWHPEWMQADARMMRLFGAFVEACCIA